MIRSNCLQCALLVVINLLALLVDKAIVLEQNLLLNYLSVARPYAIGYGLCISVALDVI